ncbi:41573_t:CDS:2 [Gigaspora margarita]|uniref:41573_t:CDS:1 n=1 Tax=Gigaspora margarita TaxID=4874 RepID=A0ABN7VBC8_GIGMA|nr:41573_t:CDS:2 [Gigaspora margarita]
MHNKVVAYISEDKNISKLDYNVISKLRNLRKTNVKLEIFVSNSGDHDEMYSQPIENYFKEDTTPTSFEPLPKQ